MESMDSPVTRYARCDGLHIAYQVVGDGPIDLLYFPNLMGHVEATWSVPSLARFLESLASFGRLIIFDQRGTGMSDPVPLPELPTLDQRVDDARAVLDAAGVERVAAIGYESGGPVALMLAAMHPSRVSGVVVANSMARSRWAPDYPVGIHDDKIDAFIERIFEARTAGGERVFDDGSEAHTHDRWAWYQRQSVSPGALKAMLRVATLVDVRDALGSISAPTLAISNRGVPAVPAMIDKRHDRVVDLAARIPGSTLLVLDDPVDPPDDLRWLADEAREFLTGVRDSADPSRVLATVLFSDIVRSTERAAASGDRAWSETLDAHDEMIRRQLTRFGGREVKALGDGFLATFDGPARAIRCAQAIRDGAHRIDLEVRVGLHTGEIERRGEDVAGMAVNIAERVGSQAAPNEVLVSRTVADLVVGSSFAFSERGTAELKGVPGAWQLFAVEG